jgi:hypothetical protein
VCRLRAGSVYSVFPRPDSLLGTLETLFGVALPRCGLIWYFGYYSSAAQAGAREVAIAAVLALALARPRSACCSPPPRWPCCRLEQTVVAACSCGAACDSEAAGVTCTTRRAQHMLRLRPQQ